MKLARKLLLSLALVSAVPIHAMEKQQAPALHFSHTNPMPININNLSDEVLALLFSQTDTLEAFNTLNQTSRRFNRISKDKVLKKHRAFLKEKQPKNTISKQAMKKWGNFVGILMASLCLYAAKNNYAASPERQITAELFDYTMVAASGYMIPRIVMNCINDFTQENSIKEKLYGLVSANQLKLITAMTILLWASSHTIPANQEHNLILEYVVVIAGLFTVMRAMFISR